MSCDRRTQRATPHSEPGGEYRQQADGHGCLPVHELRTVHQPEGSAGDECGCPDVPGVGEGTEQDAPEHELFDGRSQQHGGNHPGPKGGVRGARELGDEIGRPGPINDQRHERKNKQGKPGSAQSAVDDLSRPGPGEPEHSSQCRAAEPLPPPPEHEQQGDPARNETSGQGYGNQSGQRLDEIAIASSFRGPRCRHDSDDGPDQHLCAKVRRERGDDVPSSQTAAVWRGDNGRLHRLRGSYRGVSPGAAQHDGKAVRQGLVHSDRGAGQGQNDNDGNRNLTRIVGERRTRDECNQRDDGALGQDQLTAGVPVHGHLDRSVCWMDREACAPEARP